MMTICIEESKGFGSRDYSSSGYGTDSDESSSIELRVMIRCVGVGGEDRQRGSQGEKMRGSGMIMETE